MIKFTFSGIKNGALFFKKKKKKNNFTKCLTVFFMYFLKQFYQNLTLIIFLVKAYRYLACQHDARSHAVVSKLGILAID
jgi:hypothetical protein